MSIYGTMATLWLADDDGRPVEIDVQVVRAGIDYECSYLPPPRRLAPGEDEFLHPRAVLFVPAWSGKGGPGFEGQQYHAPLLVLAGEDYERATFDEVMTRLAEAVRRAPAAGCGCERCAQAIPEGR